MESNASHYAHSKKRDRARQRETERESVREKDKREIEACKCMFLRMCVFESYE